MLTLVVGNLWTGSEVWGEARWAGEEHHFAAEAVGSQSSLRVHSVHQPHELTYEDRLGSSHMLCAAHAFESYG